MNRLGIIGGSGIYDIEGLKLKEKIELKTPFGTPSSCYTLSELRGREIVFLPRHDPFHSIAPSFINYRANIYGMKKLGVSRILSVSACGSLQDKLKPLDFMIPDQFIDRTTKRQNTFYDKEIVVHVALANPVCANLANSLTAVLKSLGLRHHLGGVYLNMEGPQFSTKAESSLYRSWGADVIGMTNFTEARLAREAEICYVTLAAVTDYDCWHPDFGSVDVELILECLRKNSQNSKKVIQEFILADNFESSCICQKALENAIVTDLKNVNAETKEKLKIIIGKYL